MPSATVAVDVPVQANGRRSVPLPSTPERRVEGLKVIDEKPVLSNLPVPEGRDPLDFAIRGFTLVVLEDGSERYSCADCEHYGSRGAVMKHRNRMHKAPTRPREVKPTGNAATVAGLPTDLRAMSLGDVLEMGTQLQQLAIVLGNVEAQRDEYRDRCMALEAQLRKIIGGLARAGFEQTETDA